MKIPDVSTLPAKSLVFLIERRHRPMVPHASAGFCRLEEWRPAGRMRAANLDSALHDAREQIGGSPEDVRVSGIAADGKEDALAK